MKLVRDRIPELAGANGRPAGFHQADPAEFGRRLRAKLVEEAQEAATANGPAELLDERRRPPGPVCPRHRRRLPGGRG